MRTAIDVASVGGSYMAWVQWAAAARWPPHLVTMIAAGSPGFWAEDYLDWLYRVSSRSYQPSGCSVLLSAGILRASFRESLSEPAPLVPGETYVLDVELSDVGHVARPGHRLRLTLANTGEPYGAETRRVVAIQTIRHGGDHPSALTLFVRGGEPA